MFAHGRGSQRHTPRTGWRGGRDVLNEGGGRGGGVRARHSRLDGQQNQNHQPRIVATTWRCRRAAQVAGAAPHATCVHPCITVSCQTMPFVYNNTPRRRSGAWLCACVVWWRSIEGAAARARTPRALLLLLLHCRARTDGVSAQFQVGRGAAPLCASLSRRPRRTQPRALQLHLPLAHPASGRAQELTTAEPWIAAEGSV